MRSLRRWPIRCILVKQAIEHLSVRVGVFHLVELHVPVFNHWDCRCVHEWLLAIGKDHMSIWLCCRIHSTLRVCDRAIRVIVLDVRDAAVHRVSLRV